MEAYSTFFTIENGVSASLFCTVSRITPSDDLAA